VRQLAETRWLGVAAVEMLGVARDLGVESRGAEGYEMGEEKRVE
jgi:hypothetical protein